MFFKHRFLNLLLMGTGAAILCGAGPGFLPVSLTSQETNGLDEIQGQFYAAADPAVAWQVLTDYGNIPQFVSSMKVSRIEWRHKNNVLLTQEAEGGFLFITKRIHVLLKVHETPDQTIVFEDVDNRDFSVYRGSWSIEPCPQGGVSVVYQLAARKKFDAPLAGDAMNGGVRDLLADVQKEICFRQGMTGQEKGWGSAPGLAESTPVPSVPTVN